MSLCYAVLLCIAIAIASDAFELQRNLHRLQFTTNLYAEITRRRVYTRSRVSSTAETNKRRSNNNNSNNLLIKSSPVFIENQLYTAVEQLQAQKNNATTTTNTYITFPTIRECNAALASFGDNNELLRALRMFGKLRKISTLQQQQHAPTPTLVTYSTLMSRANKLNKPRVALRLWKLYCQDQNDSSVPDIKAANILMNSFAKLQKLQDAKQLLETLSSKSSSVKPNLVTYNTYLYACQLTGELDEALEAWNQIKLVPDTRTYTTLIATVARKAQKSSGKHDPSLAFELYHQLMDQRKKELAQRRSKFIIEPNGMTFSALIDVCGRCERVDLALQGLRIMLRYKQLRQKEMTQTTTLTASTNNSNAFNYTLPNEVGAWTAAINACGKAGRLTTAVRLFYSMENFGCYPNAVTCGCLVDSLLRASMTGETLAVLRYMKEHGIVPSEFMYTSLMIHAEKLVQNETIKEMDSFRQVTKVTDDNKALEVYTELMQSLQDPTHASKSPSTDKDTTDHTRLLKVFLVFQQMKATGAQPDLACYNVLLSTCARAGDISRARQVLGQIISSDILPNDTTWKEMLRTAAKLRDGKLGLDLWDEALKHKRTNHRDEPLDKWHPSADSLGVLLTSILRQAMSESDEKKIASCQQIVDFYEAVLHSDPVHGMNRINIDNMLDNQRTMLLVLRAIVMLVEVAAKDVGDNDNTVEALKRSAVSIMQLESMQKLDSRASWSSRRAWRQAKYWSGKGRTFAGSKTR